MDTIRLHDRDPRFNDTYLSETYGSHGEIKVRTLYSSGIALLNEAVATKAPWVIPVRFKDEVDGGLLQYQLYLIAQRTGFGIVELSPQLVEPSDKADNSSRPSFSPAIEYRDLGPAEFFEMPLRKLERIWHALDHGKALPGPFQVPLKYATYLTDVVAARTAEARAVRMVKLEELGSNTPDRPVKPRPATRPSPAPTA